MNYTLCKSDSFPVFLCSASGWFEWQPHKVWILRVFIMSEYLLKSISNTLTLSNCPSETSRLFCLFFSLNFKIGLFRSRLCLLVLSRESCWIHNEEKPAPSILILAKNMLGLSSCQRSRQGESNNFWPQSCKISLEFSWAGLGYFPWVLHNPERQLETAQCF